jgi:uncharacterized protein (DUF849 family)
MAVVDKVIITGAIAGAIHTPTMSPHLPITPDQIAAEATAAAEVGAAILHLHARDPETGKPDQSPEAFARFFCSRRPIRFDPLGVLDRSELRPRST